MKTKNNNQVFEKGAYVESCTQPLDIYGYVVDYAYVSGFQCVALSDKPDDKVSDNWVFSNGLRKAYERKQVLQ